MKAEMDESYSSALLRYLVGMALGRMCLQTRGLSAAEAEPAGAESWRLFAHGSKAARQQVPPGGDSGQHLSTSGAFAAAQELPLCGTIIRQIFTRPLPHE